MRVGFSGTRHGMTFEQAASMLRLLTLWRLEEGAQAFHHGDCVGADAEAHRHAISLGYDVVVHPPIDGHARAWCIGDGVTYRAPGHYLARNRAIALSTDRLLAAPRTHVPGKGGTWYTVNFALGCERPVWLVLPSGEVNTR